MQFKLLAHLLSFTLISSVVCQGVATNGTKSDQDSASDLATSNPEEFEVFLKSLSKSKNRECESRTLKNVLKALSTAQPRSYVFIFTNGPAKDYYLVSKVLEKLAEKKSQVVFVLGELCAAPSHVGYQVYERIARQSLGQVLHLSRKDVDLALRFVETVIHVDKVQLLALNSKESGVRTFNFLVDRHLKNIVISTIGKKHVQVKIKPPKNAKASNVEKVIKTSSMVVSKIENPQEGLWNVVVKSTGNYSIRVTSKSQFFVSYGFSTTKYTQKDESFKLKNQPILDATNYLYVSFKSKKKRVHLGILSQVDLLTLNGKVIRTLPVSLDSLLEDSFVVKFIPPRDPFLLRFVGVDDEGDFARVSPNVVDPSLPDRPRITMKKQYRGFMGQDLALYCYVESSVPFTVTWSHGNTPLSNPTNYVKNVNSSLWVNSGAGSEFTCTARNIAGVSSQTTTVSFNIPPPIIEENGNRTALLGENVFLQCLAFSTVPIKIKWYRGNKEILTDRRFVVTTDLQVAISNVRVEDSGWYSCVASNGGGQSINSFYLKVYEDPIISVFPQIQVFKVGESFAFACDVVGQVPPYITWLKDDKNLPKIPRIQQDPPTQLYISDAKVTDEGKYACVANYSHIRNGVVLRSYSFAEYRTPPKAKIRIQDISALTGSPVTLKCSAKGKPEPSINWHKNGEPIKPNKRIVTSERSLFILESKVEDTGSYSCVAQNSEGLDFASTHILIGTKPTIKEERVRRVEVKRNTNVTLECTAIGIPKPYVYWIDSNGKEIEKNSGVVRLSSGKLLITSMKKKYTGKYLCKAENQFGSEMAQIDVEILGLEKPKIRSLKEPLIYAKINSDIILPCEVTGKTQPKFKWVRRGGNFDLTNDRFQILANGSLLIKNVTAEDSATYVCKASNDVGSTRADRKLIVTIPPTWTLKPGEQYELFEGEELRLECFASGIPRPRISWKHNGKLLDLKEDILVIKEVNKTSNGTYKCIVRNEGGKITAETTVLVKDFNVVGVSSYELAGTLPLNRPLQTREIDILRFVVLPEDTRIKAGVSQLFSCIASGNPTPVVTWQRSGVAMDTPLYILPNNSLVINNARLEDGGFYACVAENERGKIMKDFIVTVVVNGGFSQWSDWGPCSKSCGEGKQLRNRYCNNPSPQNGGDKCEGYYVQQRACNQNPCVKSTLASWSSWGRCSQSCEGGRQSRIRPCSAGTRDCPHGMQFEHRLCNRFRCGGILGITEVIGSVSGTVNRQDIGSIALMADISYVNQFVKISLDVKGIPKPLLYIMRSVVSFMVPVYWSVVNQGRDGFNGISIAAGKFTYTGKIKYNDVQILVTTCLVSAIPGSKSLMMETSLSGDVQHFPRKGFSPQNYNEVFLQTSPNSIYGYSERYILIGESSTKYSLEHTITYASDYTLNFPAQTYNVRPDKLVLNEDEMSLRHEVTASYLEGTDKCPDGFLKDDRFCADVNECLVSTQCEQLCINTNGSYHCSCNKGFFLSRDGVSCQDINECRQSFHNCKNHELCINTRGGYVCKEKQCSRGFARDEKTRECEDIDECEKDGICPVLQTCVNTIGSYECMWVPCSDAGFVRANNGTCIDLDECSDNPGVCAPDEDCKNTYGSYQCVKHTKCDPGFRRDPMTMACEDINECLLDVCKPNEICLNKKGSYACFTQTCEPGFENVDGRCVDIDECKSNDACLPGQRCFNNEGSYFCFTLPCQAGYKRVNGTCQDIDECAGNKNKCNTVFENCVNTLGDYFCERKLCRIGYQMSDKGICEDINECSNASSPCKPDQDCVNLEGSYKCEELAIITKALTTATPIKPTTHMPNLKTDNSLPKTAHVSKITTKISQVNADLVVSTSPPESQKTDKVVNDRTAIIRTDAMKQVATTTARTNSINNEIYENGKSTTTKETAYLAKTEVPFEPQTEEPNTFEGIFNVNTVASTVENTNQPIVKTANKVEIPSSSSVKDFKGPTFEPHLTTKESSNIIFSTSKHSTNAKISSTHNPSTTKRASSTTEFPTAVPLVTDEYEYETSWWIFDRFKTPNIPSTTAKSSSSNLRLTKPSSPTTRNKNLLTKENAHVKKDTSGENSPAPTRQTLLTDAKALLSKTPSTEPKAVTEKPVKTNPPATQSTASPKEPAEVTEEPVKTDAPAAPSTASPKEPEVVTAEPVETDAPAPLSTASPKEPEVVTEAPVKTDAPAPPSTALITEPAVATEKPVKTDAPAPPSTASPKEPEVVTEARVKTDAPAPPSTALITEPTVATKKPAKTDAPAEPSTASPKEPEVVTEEPVKTDAPAEPSTVSPTEPKEVTEEPVKTDAPAAPSTASPKEPAVVTEEPVKTDAPAAPSTVSPKEPAVVTEEPVKTDAPAEPSTASPKEPKVVTAEPVETDAPAEPSTASPKEPEIVTKAPIKTDAPAPPSTALITEPAAATEKPVKTDAPAPPSTASPKEPEVVSEAPVKTDAPAPPSTALITEPAVATEKPAKTDAPAPPSTASPEEPEVVTEAPVKTDAPAPPSTALITEPAVATEKPAKTDAPAPPSTASPKEPEVVTAEPVETDAPAEPSTASPKEPEVVTEAPVKTDTPAPPSTALITEPEVVKKEPVKTDAPAPASIASPKEPKVVTEAPVDTDAPAPPSTASPKEPEVVTKEPVKTDAPVPQSTAAATEPAVVTNAPVKTNAPGPSSTAPPTKAPVITKTPSNTDAPNPSSVQSSSAPTKPSVDTDAPMKTETFVAPTVATTKPPTVVTGEETEVVCPFGYKAKLKGVCEDIDECNERSHSCHEDQICVNIRGGHRCACRRGFRMRDGDRKCVDVDECRMSLQLCQQDCVNTVGSYNCKCRAGYVLRKDQRTCIADKQTSQSNMIGRRAKVLYAKPIRCFNFMGSTMCFCPQTFKWNRYGMRCEKTIVLHNSVKERFLLPNPNRCFMFHNTKFCRCPSDYKWDMARRHCRWSPYMNADNEVGLQQGGINVKESDVIQAVKSSQITAAVPTTVAVTTKQLVVRTTEEPCPEFFARACTHKCMTMNKMYLCSCPAGYQKKYHGHCSDINECTAGQNGCTKQQYCFNTLGSYRCVDLSCPEGFLHYGKRMCRKPCTKRPTGPRDICTDRFINFRQFAVPKGTKQGSRLATLRSSHYYSFFGKSQFYFRDGQSYFTLRNFGAACSLNTKRDLIYPGDYSVEIVGDVINNKGQLLCRTTFKILVNVGNYAF
ncbi:hemicentin-1-like isoform X2 [Rhopilema esculentum]|uniref:hemicentin-1-like isoform X2 n=1 Tax=Rhopilema esculentum TaxID=499914 RepID=UPI0031DC61AA